MSLDSDDPNFKVIVAINTAKNYVNYSMEKGIQYLLGAYNYYDQISEENPKLAKQLNETYISYLDKMF